MLVSLCEVYVPKTSSSIPRGRRIRALHEGRRADWGATKRIDRFWGAKGAHLIVELFGIMFV